MPNIKTAEYDDVKHVQAIVYSNVWRLLHCFIESFVWTKMVQSRVSTNFTVPFHVSYPLLIARMTSD